MGSRMSVAHQETGFVRKTCHVSRCQRGSGDEWDRPGDRALRLSFLTHITEEASGNTRNITLPGCYGFKNRFLHAHKDGHLAEFTTIPICAANIID